ncbi:MAG: hypothetical protein LIP06_12245 [Tannerellaceae bacterium]|nr:hypothetical protein [Tannerellaceae bacterium]
MKNAGAGVWLSGLMIWMLSACTPPGSSSGQVEQVSIARIEQMPNMPSPYKILDWKQKAVDLDNFIFDFNSTFPSGPVIWIDNNQRNIPQVTFGIYTAIHDVRQGPLQNNGEFHESLNSFPAIMGAGLLGIDKTHQNGYNYVKMIQNYFNTENGWNIMMNNTCPEVALLGGGYGRDWWYDVLPNALFYAICDIFPGVENADHIQKTIAEQFYKADQVLDGNYNYSYFDYARMKGVVNHIPLQQDAAGGHGYVLYSAYRKYKDPRYLQGAISAITALNNQTESRFYEVLLPLGIYTAARLNATEGTHFDIRKMMNWVFEGCRNPEGRYGWGIIQDTWGDYDVSGLQGSITDGGGYAFLMNSIKMAWPLVPMVKYEPRYARAIGKWMLNNVNACRLFFPYEIDDEHQWLSDIKGITNGVIAYEGLRKTDDYGKNDLTGVTPVAIGDGPKWNEKNPPESMFSIYSTTPVGIFGAMVETTNVEGILRLDCNVTDFYADKPHPVYLYYNPHPEEKTVEYLSTTPVDLYDTLTKTYVSKNSTGSILFTIPSDQARLITVLPAGTK